MMTHVCERESEIEREREREIEREREREWMILKIGNVSKRFPPVFNSTLTRECVT